MGKLNFGGYLMFQFHQTRKYMHAKNAPYSIAFTQLHSDIIIYFS